MVYEPTTNFKDSNGVDLGKKLVTQDYVATVYPNLNQAFAGLIANPAELYSWGGGTTGSVGDNLNADRSTPRQEFTFSANWKQVSVGSSKLALKTNGTMWTWGLNNFGQIGDNTIASRSTPRQISAGATRISNWRMVSTQNRSSAAIAIDGTLWCWGYNAYGQIGDNTTGSAGAPGTNSRSTPRQISAGATGITGWKQVDCGAFCTFAIRQDGTLWGWGDNINGQIGDNTTAGRSTPRQISAGANGITNWKQVSAGYHIAAIKTDGTLWLWGNNAGGQLGRNDRTNRLTPVQEWTSSTNWKQVSVGAGTGGFHITAAIKTDGTLWVWGGNGRGEIGDNTNGAGTGTNSRSTPRQEFTLSTNWKQVSAGYQQVAAIKTDGTLWLWGSNNAGVIGDNTSVTSRSTPRQEFTSGTTWRQVEINSSNVSAIKYPFNRGY